MLYFLIIITSLLMGGLLYLVYAQQQTITELRETIETQETEQELQTGRYSKLLSQKKQSEVRLGFISEKIAPFLEDFKWSVKELQFLGNPIDFIHFGKKKVTFIEVKSGKSRLSSSQRHIRDLIREKKVEFVTYRIK